MTREQMKLLIERLNRCARKPSPEIPEPANVKAARKVVQAYDRKKRDAEHRASKAWQKKRTEVREQIYFGDSAKALAAVKKLEALSA